MSRTRTKDASEVALLMGEAFAQAARTAVGRAVAVGVTPAGESGRRPAPAPGAKKTAPPPSVVKLAAKAPAKAPLKKAPAKAAAKAARK